MTEERNESFATESEMTVETEATETATCCASCGAPLDAKDKFCMSCGAKVDAPVEEVEVPSSCASCGAPLDAKDKFCMSCGAKVGAPTEVAETVPAPAPKKSKKKVKIIAIVAAALILVTALGIGGTKLIASSMAEEKAVGIWRSETIYLSSYGGDCQRLIEICSDGSYYGLILNVNSNSYEKFFYGTWYVDGNKIAMQEEGEYGTAYYKYRLNDTLKNGDIKYERSVL